MKLNRKFLAIVTRATYRKAIKEAYEAEDNPWDGEEAMNNVTQLFKKNPTYFKELFFKNLKELELDEEVDEETRETIDDLIITFVAGLQ